MGMTNLQRVEILRASCCIASADGEISDGELAQLKKLAHGLGVGDASLNAMMGRAQRDPDFYKTQFGVLRDEPILTIDILLESVLANGQIKQPELVVLQGLAERLGIRDEDFRERVNLAVDKHKSGTGGS